MKEEGKRELKVSRDGKYIVARLACKRKSLKQTWEVTKAQKLSNGEPRL